MRWMRFAALGLMSGCPACDDDEGRRPAGTPGPNGVAACRLETTEVDYLKDGSIDPPAAYTMPSVFQKSTTCCIVSTTSGELNGIS